MPPAAKSPMPWLERVRDPSLTALLAGLLLLRDGPVFSESAEHAAA